MDNEVWLPSFICALMQIQWTFILPHTHHTSSSGSSRGMEHQAITANTGHLVLHRNNCVKKSIAPDPIFLQSLRACMFTLLCIKHSFYCCKCRIVAMFLDN